MEYGEPIERTATRETLDAKLRYAIFDGLMDMVYLGELSFDQAVEKYRQYALSQQVSAVAGAIAVQGA